MAGAGRTGQARRGLEGYRNVAINTDLHLHFFASHDGVLHEQ